MSTIGARRKITLSSRSTAKVTPLTTKITAPKLRATSADSKAMITPMRKPISSTTGTPLAPASVAMAIELEAEGIMVNAVAPGFTRTNLNAYEGRESVEEGAREAVRVALLGPDGPTGTFSHARHGMLPW